ncbi:MAG: replication-associated recombination protein A [Bacteroidetes bacterium]|nr:replication-associated recombination protein A [Bacteroidota bacterium]MBU1678574.1 replication-associated recombination protein A [Bacteroidota bacterium]MBU2505170.1 replication-associated recombination protein A [Bacteroidota bacterium]
MESKSNRLPIVPLAERIRPTTLDEFQGQKNLVGSGSPIRKMIESDLLSSFILWGPPGTGKTTLAKIISEQTKSDFFKLNAVSSGVKDVRSVIESAKKNMNHNKKTILFLDEIHRFNKAQQDALLNSVESGEIILIGATTENPSFEVIPALRSRARVYVLEELSKDDLNSILNFALIKDEFLASLHITDIDRDFLFYVSGGDARGLLNILESAVTNEINEKEIRITKAVIENVIQRKNILYDKSGEEHYNVISAFIKSVRGSDPDAALYWMARMLEGGEDPLFIARRLVVLASEDIGNASPNALVLAEATFSAVHKIGMPEARIILSQCVTYLASSPKSNSSYFAIDEAIGDVKNKPLYNVPLHLRNAPTKLMKDLGYGKEYKYPHSFNKHFIEEEYFPKEMNSTQYYFPSENGQEKNIRDRLRELWKGKKKY